MPLQVIKPLYRKLRGYALDPSYASNTSTATISQVVYKIPWEEAPELNLGPVGGYVEVIDEDENGDPVSPPLDLADIYVLAQDGLAPSEKNLQFHQQMVYAVAMTTIKSFEKGLGRSIQWCQEFNEPVLSKQDLVFEEPKQAVRVNRDKDGYIGRLIIYPHGIREPNAYFSPERNALMFGYFPSTPAEVTLQMPNSMIYTCLSHDIIAHETTHAIIHGLYSSYTDDINPDTLAFHEAFADLVALFQHFSFPDLIKNQVAKTRGDLSDQNFLIEIAHQFGTAIGNYGSLRNAIGEIDNKTKQWKKKIPSGKEYATIFEPHERGQILVSVIFEAFTTIYQNKIADLIRIATGGSGILQQGELHPDLVNRLSDEASGTAMHVSRMCIRALDYCPPTDITFGDFLRALITADMDLVEEDKNGYRLAMIEAFRKRGIYPSEIASLSEESLRYPLLEEEKNVNDLLKDIALFLRDYRKEIIITRNRKDIFNITRQYIHGDTEKKITGLYERIIKNNEFADSNLFAMLTGLVFNKEWKRIGIKSFKKFGITSPSFEIKTLHLASRVTSEGKKSNQIIISILQKAKLHVEVHKGKKEAFTVVPANNRMKKNVIELTGGCTLLFDLDSLALRYAISKPLLDIPALQKNVYQINIARAKKLYEHIRNTNDGSLV